MKKNLLKLLKTKEEARSALVAKSAVSQDVVELRGINTQITDLNGEIIELRGMIDALPVDGLDDQSQRLKILNFYQT